MEMTEYAPGRPSWVDLGTPDADAGAAFYAALFGWEITAGPPEAGGYRMCMYAGAPVAGMGPVADTDAAAARVLELGGVAAVEPTDIPPGRFAGVRRPPRRGVQHHHPRRDHGRLRFTLAPRTVHPTACGSSGR